MILKSKLILAIASFLNGWQVEAITIWPFVITGADPNPVTLQHERIHLAQWNELWVAGFLAVYSWYYVRGCLDEPDSAYALNPLEMEAYRWEREPEYLFTREPFAWREFIGT